MDDDQVILSLLEAVKETNKDCSKGHARGYYKFTLMIQDIHF